MVTAQFPKEQSAEGEFVRQDSLFRGQIRAGRDSEFPAQAGRYHLYVSLACPWAHRTIIARERKGLHDVISMSVVDPIRDERGWAFRDGPGHSRDPLNDFGMDFSCRQSRSLECPRRVRSVGEIG